MNQETLRELATELIQERLRDTDKRDAYEFLGSQGVLPTNNDCVTLADAVNKARVTINWED